MRTETVKVGSRNNSEADYAVVVAGVEWFNILLGCVSRILGLSCTCNDIAAPHFSILFLEGPTTWP